MFVFVSSVGCLCVITVALDCYFGFCVNSVVFSFMNLSFRCCFLICFMLLDWFGVVGLGLLCCSGA